MWEVAVGQRPKNKSTLPQRGNTERIILFQRYNNEILPFPWIGNFIRVHWKGNKMLLS